jgi:hypothetical protein
MGKGIDPCAAKGQIGIEQIAQAGSIAPSNTVGNAHAGEE